MSADRPTRLYDCIGVGCDTTRRADTYIHGRLAHHLADPAEVSAGCQRLQADIESGHNGQVVRDYDQVEGDYLFVVAEK